MEEFEILVLPFDHYDFLGVVCQLPHLDPIPDHVPVLGDVLSEIDVIPGEEVARSGGGGAIVAAGVSVGRGVGVAVVRRGGDHHGDGARGGGAPGRVWALGRRGAGVFGRGVGSRGGVGARRTGGSEVQRVQRSKV